MNYKAEWNQLLVLSGVKFSYNDRVNEFELLDSYQNNRFINEVVEYTVGNWKTNYLNSEIQPPSLEAWIYALKKKAEKNSEEMYDIKRLPLEALDVYMLGVVGQFNALGINTTYSCSGHGVEKPIIGFRGEQTVAQAADILRSLGVDFFRRNRSYITLKIKEADLVYLSLALDEYRKGNDSVTLREIIRADTLDKLLSEKG